MSLPNIHDRLCSGGGLGGGGGDGGGTLYPPAETVDASLPSESRQNGKAILFNEDLFQRLHQDNNNINNNFNNHHNNNHYLTRSESNLTSCESRDDILCMGAERKSSDPGGSDSNCCDLVDVKVSFQPRGCADDDDDDHFSGLPKSCCVDSSCSGLPGFCLGKNGYPDEELDDDEDEDVEVSNLQSYGEGNLDSWTVDIIDVKMKCLGKDDP